MPVFIQKAAYFRMSLGERQAEEMTKKVSGSPDFVSHHLGLSVWYGVNCVSPKCIG